MAQTKERREKGTGTIWKKDNGTWMGRISIGTNAEGKRKFKSFSGKTEAEVKRKIREYNKNEHPDPSKISLETYIYNWLTTYKKNTIKDTSYDALEKTVRNYVVPHLGCIRLQEITADDIQKMLQSLKDAGFSYSTVKKAYNCMNEIMRHAVIRQDIIRNPMLLVTMLSQEGFEKKEIRFFNKKECALITEEAMREYSTGRRVYIYGDVFILAMNTGLRLGELLALEKEDWDRESKTLTVKRNLQFIRNRDEDGNVAQGRRAVINSTKTYSGNRVVPLNKRATEALERLCAQHPDKKNIICSTKGTMVPHERVERTFDFLLSNIGIERAGMHSLRHTFASMLFANGKDIKTISQLLGHATIQITMNTYIHLFEKVDHDAVASLDDEI